MTAARLPETYHGTKSKNMLKSSEHSQHMEINFILTSETVFIQILKSYVNPKGNRQTLFPSPNW